MAEAEEVDLSTLAELATRFRHAAEAIGADNYSLFVSSGGQSVRVHNEREF